MGIIRAIPHGHYVEFQRQPPHRSTFEEDQARALEKARHLETEAGKLAAAGKIVPASALRARVRLIRLLFADAIAGPADRPTRVDSLPRARRTSTRAKVSVRCSCGILYRCAPSEVYLTRNSGNGNPLLERHRKQRSCPSCGRDDGRILGEEVIAG